MNRQITLNAKAGLRSEGGGREGSEWRSWKGQGEEDEGKTFERGEGGKGWHGGGGSAGKEMMRRRVEKQELN